MTIDPYQNFQERCRKDGFRLTKQKEAIYKALLEDETHPRAEDIYAKLQRDFPKLSLATVYNNLKKFVELGLIREVSCGENCRRYEAKMESHHHIINMENKTIEDVHLPPNVDIPIPPSLKGKMIKEIKISYII